MVLGAKQLGDSPMARGWKKERKQVQSPDYSEPLGKYAAVLQVDINVIKRCAKFNLDRGRGGRGRNIGRNSLGLR